MTGSHQDRVPTATEICKAVHQIRDFKPGIGVKKLVPMLREKHGWSIHGSRLRKLVAPGESTDSTPGMSCCGECGIPPKFPVLNSMFRHLGDLFSHFHGRFE